VKFISQLVTAASGSVRGCVFSRNRSGAYIRGRGIPVNPASPQQQLMRTGLARAVARWTNVLTTAQRAAWNAWAANVPDTDALAQEIRHSGQNAYILNTLARVQRGYSQQPEPPNLFASLRLTTPSLGTVDPGTDTIQIFFHLSDPWTNVNFGFCNVYVSRPQNPSVTRFKGPFRFAGVLEREDSYAPDFDTLNAPFPFASGHRLFFQYRAALQDFSGVSALAHDSFLVP